MRRQSAFLFIAFGFVCPEQRIGPDGCPGCCSSLTRPVFAWFRHPVSNRKPLIFRRLETSGADHQLNIRARVWGFLAGVVALIPFRDESGRVSKLGGLYEIGNPVVASDVEFLGWQMVVARVAAENRTGVLIWKLLWSS